MIWSNGCWGFPWFGIVFLVLFLFWTSRRRGWQRWDKRNYQNSAEDILAEKYAKGELTGKEYSEKIDVLKKYSR